MLASIALNPVLLHFGLTIAKADLTGNNASSCVIILTLDCHLQHATEKRVTGVAIDGCIFESNTAVVGGGANLMGEYGFDMKVSINASKFNSNTGQESGGGLASRDLSSLNIEHTNFTANKARAVGGGVFSTVSRHGLFPQGLLLSKEQVTVFTEDLIAIGAVPWYLW